MTRSTNMEHVEVLERLRGVLEHGKMGDKCLIAPDLVTAAIAALSAQSPAEAQPDWEVAPPGATHYQPHQDAYYKRVSASEWYVWSRVDDRELMRWLPSLGTGDSAEWVVRPTDAMPPPSAPVGVKTLSEFMAEQEALHPGIRDKVQAATDELRASLAQQPEAQCGEELPSPLNGDFDCPKAAAARSCPCGFCRALRTPSAPVGVEGLARLLERIRDLLASLPVDCLGSGTDASGQPYPIRDEVIHGITKALAQQPAAAGEEIMVNAAHDVFILPLQPSGLSSGPRFVVHVPAPAQKFKVGDRVVACETFYHDEVQGIRVGAYGTVRESRYNGEIFLVDFDGITPSKSVNGHDGAWEMFAHQLELAPDTRPAALAAQQGGSDDA